MSYYKRIKNLIKSDLDEDFDTPSMTPEKIKKIKQARRDGAISPDDARRLLADLKPTSSTTTEKPSTKWMPFKRSMPKMGKDK